MPKKKFRHTFVKKLAESASILFSALLVFSALVYAATSWTPGSAPLAAPGDGNVVTDSSWAKNGPNKIFYNSGNVGIGTSDPSATLEVNGNIVAADPTANNHIATKSYVDAAGGGSWSLLPSTTDCDTSNQNAVRFNTSSTVMEYCDGSTWYPIMSAPSGGDTILPSTSNPTTGGGHTADMCLTAGGSGFEEVDGKYYCIFSGSSCASGWAKYKHYNQKTDQTCGSQWGGNCACTSSGWNTVTCGSSSTWCQISWTGCWADAQMYAKWSVTKVACY